MAKETDKHPEKDKSSSRAPETKPVTSGAETGMAELVTSPMMGADVQAQSARLGDARFSTVQRQMMAGQMANLHGNQHMVRVIQGMSARPSIGARNGAGAIQMKAADAPTGETEEAVGGNSSPDSAATSAPPPNEAGKEEAKADAPTEVIEIEGAAGGGSEEKQVVADTPPTPKEPADFSAVITKEMPTATEGATLQGANPATGDTQAETQAAKAENMADAEAGLSEMNAANSAVAAQKDEAAATSQAADEELAATLGGLNELANSDVQFAPPEIGEEEAETTEGDGEVIFRKELGPDDDLGGDPDPQVNAALAAARVNQFISSNSGEVARITSLGQTVAPRLMPLAEQAKAEIQAQVDAQIGAVLQAIAAARIDVMTEVGTTKADIQGQHDSAVTAIKAATVTAKTKVETDYAAKLTELTTLQTAEAPKIDEVFDNAAKGVRDAAVTKGKEATDIATRKKAEFDKETPPPPPDEGGFLNAVGDVADFLTGDTYGKNWIQAKKGAADGVAEEYKKQFNEKAEQTAAQILNGKKEGASALQKTIDDTRKALETEKATAIKEIDQAETDSLKTASDTLTEQLGLVDQSLQGVLDNLSSLETTFPQQLTSAGEQQKLGVDRDVQQIITAIQQAISESSNSLLQGLQSLSSQVQSIPAPDPVALDQFLNNAQGEFSGVIMQSEAGIETQIGTAEGQVLTLGQQGAETILTQGEGLLAQVAPIATDFATSVAQLVTSSAETFKQVETDHTTGVNQRATDTATHFQDLYNYGKGEIDAIRKHLETEIGKTVTDFSAGLDTSLKEVEPKIVTEADAAAKKVQPSWKRFVAFVLTVIITVLVAVAIAALVASGVGFVAGLLIAAAIGAAAGLMKQALTNWSTGEPLSKDLVKAAVLGALDGMLQFAGGRFVKSLKFPETGFSFKKLATEAAVNTVSGIVTDISTLAWDGKLTWESAGQAIVANVANGVMSLAGNVVTGKLGAKLGLDGPNLTGGQKFKKAAMDVGVGTVFDTLGDKDLWQKGMKGELTWEDVGNSARKNLTTNTIKTAMNVGLENANTKKKLTDFADNKIKPIEESVKGAFGGNKSSQSNPDPAAVVPPTTTETTTSTAPVADDDVITDPARMLPPASDIITDPARMLPPASDIITDPARMLPPASDIITDPARMLPPASDIITDPARMLPPASDVITDPARMLPPASDVITDPARMLPPASDIITDPARMLPPASDIITDPARMLPPASDIITDPARMLPPASDIITDPARMLPPASDIITDPARMLPPASDIITDPARMLPPASEKKTSTSNKSSSTSDDDVITDPARLLPAASEKEVTASSKSNKSPHDELKQMGVSDVDAAKMSPEQAEQVKSALDSWNSDKNGKNQGVTHIVDYAQGLGGEGKKNRLDKLAEYTGTGPFDVNDPLVMPKVTQALDGLTAGASIKQTVGDKEIIFIPASDSSPGKNQKGIVVIKYGGKYASFMNTKFGDYEKTVGKEQTKFNQTKEAKIDLDSPSSKPVVPEEEVTTSKPVVPEEEVTTSKPVVPEEEVTTSKPVVPEEEVTGPKPVVPDEEKTETKGGVKNEIEEKPKSNKTTQQVLDEHKNELAKWPHLQQELNDIDKMPDGPAKQQRLAELEQQALNVQNNTRPLADISPELAGVVAQKPEVADMVNQVVQKHGQAGVDLLTQYFNGGLKKEINDASKLAGIPEQYLTNMMNDPVLGDMVIGLRPSNVKFLDDQVRQNTYPKTPVDVLMPDGTVAKASSQSAVVFKTDKETGLVKVMVDVGGVQVPHGVVKGEDGVWRAVPLADLHQDGKINMQYGLPMGPDVDLYFILGKGQNDIIDWKQVDPTIMGAIINACGEQRSTGEMLSAIQHGAHVPYMADKMASELDGADAAAVHKYLHDKILGDNGLVYVGGEKKFLWVPGSSIPILYDILGHKFPGKP